jgi:penicillin-binding protein 2
MGGGSLEPPPVDLNLNREELARILRGLREVVTGKEGTARSLAGLPIVGKTGTAQVASLQEGVSVEDMDPNKRHHAWFAGWAPVEKPEMVVVVVVEHGGGGATVAVPVAEKVFRAVLETRRDTLPRIQIENQAQSAPP